MQQLLDRGANIEAADSNGRTALLRAAQYRQDIIVQQLLNHSINIETADTNGITTLLHAIKYGRDIFL